MSNSSLTKTSRFKIERLEDRIAPSAFSWVEPDCDQNNGGSHKGGSNNGGSHKGGSNKCDTKGGSKKGGSHKGGSNKGGSHKGGPNKACAPVPVTPKCKK